MIIYNFGIEKGYQSFQKNIYSKAQLITEKNLQSPAVDEIKISLLKSQQLSPVIIGAVMNFVPLDKIELDYGDSYYDFRFYGTELTEEQHAQFLNFAYPYNNYLGSTDVSILNESPVWIGYSNSDDALILAKDGFVCITPPNYGPTLCADNESGDCIYPSFLGIKCTSWSNPTENTLNNVSLFLKKSLEEARVQCKECEIRELPTEFISIPQLSKKLVFFEKLDSLSREKYIDIVLKETEKSMQYFTLANWTVEKIDYTDTEKKWDKNVIISTKINATNKKFNCAHGITISNFQSVISKREIITCSLKQSFFDKKLNQ